MEKILQLPILNLFLGDIKVYEILSLIIALVINFLILISYSNFNPVCALTIPDGSLTMYECPSILYGSDLFTQESKILH